MSEGGSASEVWKSIELGAAEYLEKPLSTLKLRNIWQHVVRKVSSASAHSAASLWNAGVLNTQHSFHFVHLSFCIYTQTSGIVCR